MKPRTQAMLKPALVLEKAASVTGIRPNPIPLGTGDDAFDALYARVSARTVVSRARCHVLYQCALQARNVAGDGAEVGVYRGGTALLLRETFAGPEHRLHLFDTFGGMPEVDPDRDVHVAGDFDDTSLDEVRAFVGEGPELQYHQGLFPETAEGLEDARFAFVHVDADIFTSVRDSCAFFYPRMHSGAILVFDDYGFRSCPGARAAVDGFFATLPEVPLYLPTGQALVHKL